MEKINMPKSSNKLTKFTDEELMKELNRRNVDKETLAHKTLNIDGFTTKDVVCMQGGAYDDPDDEYGPHCHFYLKVDGKLFDIYYMNRVSDPQKLSKGESADEEPSRWPELDDGNAALEFVPPGFAEACENCYECRRLGDVKKYLAKYGITDYRVWNPKLVSIDKNGQGHDANYDFNL